MTRIRTYIRFLWVTVNFLPIGLTYVRDQRKYLLFGSSRSVSSDMRVNRARQIKETMLRLGPTFIKLGQVLSTRPDILPSEYTDELTSLQDDVPPSNWTDVQRQIREELGSPIDNVYDNFNREAISGASLAQVHEAEINNEKVAVKVRRPGVENQVKRDIQVMKWLKPIILRFVGDARSFSIETIVDEFSETLEQEMDYKRELNELEIIGSNFESNSNIRIPKPLPEYSTEEVLTMEYVDGTKIDDIDSIDDMDLNRTEISELIQETYFQMVIDDGVFHADPHPGNIAVQKDGTIVFYDFGMTGRIGQKTRDQIVELYLAIATDRFGEAIDVLIDMGIVDPEADKDLMIEAFKLAVKDARGEDIDQRRAEDLLQSMEKELYRFPFRIPPDFSLLIRTATIANGVCLKLDPSIDFIEVVSDLLKQNGYVQSSAVRMTQNQIENASNSLRKLLETPSQLNKAIDKINNDEIEARVDIKQEERITRLAKKIVASILMSGMAISAAVLYLADPYISMIPIFFFVLFGIAYIRT